MQVFNHEVSEDTPATHLPFFTSHAGTGRPKMSPEKTLWLIILTFVLFFGAKIGFSYLCFIANKPFVF
jgi:membrane glycosyltransferase